MLKHLLMKEGRQEETNKDPISDQFGSPIHMIYCKTGHEADAVDPAIGYDVVALLFKAQCPIRLLEVELLPDYALAAHATDYVTFTFGKTDAAAGAVTAFDSFDTATGGDNVSLVAQTKKSLTIVPSTDTLAKGDYLCLKTVCAGAKTKFFRGTILIKWAPIEAVQ